eukprot:1160064-Pelagomonas_calceolata.AAC.6
MPNSKSCMIIGGNASLLPPMQSMRSPCYLTTACTLKFEPPSMGKTFTLTVATLGIFFLPVWVMAYSDYQMADFQNRCVFRRGMRGSKRITIRRKEIDKQEHGFTEMLQEKAVAIVP